MGSPPQIDIGSLIAPIPGDDPAGSSLPFEVREKLEEARKEDNPDDYAADDPMRPEKFKKADWPGIINLGKEMLTGKSKDLLVAARMTEALVKLHGYGGFRDGLRLLRQLVTDCWDRVLPSIEDGDVEVRAGPFNWLDDADRGARFPNTLRRVPLVSGEGGAYTYLDWKRGQDGSGQVTTAQFQEALQAAPPEQCQLLADDLAECQQELKLLTDALNAKMQQSAPGLTAIRQAVTECGTLVRQIVKLKGGDAAPEEEAGSAAAPGAAAGRSAGSRAEVYRQLGQLAATLQQIEPHSPIPFLIKRAVELGALSFPQLIKELVRDAASLSDVQRFVGLKEDEAPK